jgi:hypothetical protein
LKLKGLKEYLFSIFFLSTHYTCQAVFPNLNRADPLPMFSSIYPYEYLASRQKAGLMRFDYTYAENRFRVSVSGFRQSANCGRDSLHNTVNLGDMNGRWNMLGLFYDEALRNVLYPALGIDPNKIPDCGTNPQPDSDNALIQDPRFVDPNKEFGFFSIPLRYRKYGVRFDTQILLIDRCYYAVGLEIQWGINDVRQTASFEDFTCQALGIGCPAGPDRINNNNIVPTPGLPGPVIPSPVAPPFIDPVTVPPCPQTGCNPAGTTDCIEPLQPFQPADTSTLFLSFPPECKQFVIENIMEQKYRIAHILGIDINNYHKIALDDLRISAFWRHIFIINEDDERYPRLLFMPFAQVGVGIPMSKEINNSTMFAVPVANNHHTFVGGLAGFTLDFLDTIDLSFAGGFSYFFKHDYCNFRMPTNFAESGIFPYAADVSLQPGPTWHFNVGMHAWHFLDNLSFWAEYCVISHAQDKITVCRSFIPENSRYFESGFQVERVEHLSKWEVQLANIGFNYDLFDCLSIGLFWQAPIKQRNAYKSSTILGTISFVY